MNRGSEKEATVRVLKTGLPISYLFCKSDLIMSFNSFINLLSPLAGVNLSTICFMIGTRPEAVACFSPAKASVKKDRGLRTSERVSRVLNTASA